MGPTTHNRYDIIGGPSKYDLDIALTFRKYPRQSVKFEIITEIEKRHKNAEVQIILLKRIDENGKLPGQEGHWWYFLGNTIGSDDPYLCRRGTGFLRGVYSTKTRTGWIEELPLEHTQAIDRVLGAEIPLSEFEEAFVKAAVGTGP